MRIQIRASTGGIETVNQTAVAIKSGVKAGGLPGNHNAVAVSV